MRYGSVCSGIEAASVAWRPLGWKCAFVSEIEKFPAAVLAERFPDVPNLGDFTKIETMKEAILRLSLQGWLFAHMNSRHERGTQTRRQ